MFVFGSLVKAYGLVEMGGQMAGMPKSNADTLLAQFCSISAITGTHPHWEEVLFSAFLL